MSKMKKSAKRSIGVEKSAGIDCAAIRDIRRSLHRSALLAGASALTLMLAPPVAYARPLFGGGNASAAVNAAANAAIASAQQAAEMARQSLSSMTRAAQAVQAMRAAQTAAHNLALSSPPKSPAGLTAVTDGLSPGGLVVDPRVTAGTDPNLWVNATLPTQSTSNGATTVSIQQTSQRAVLTWAQFNVGKNTTVDFDQSGGNSANGNSWVALNRVDATGVPSQILGQINAQGTVLIINPNGIIFAGSSQINVHSLIAAAVDLNGYSGNNVGVFNSAGAYNSIATMGGQAVLAPANEDSANQTFLASGLFINNATNVAGTSGQVFFAAPASSQVGMNVGVQVKAGAQIVSAVSGTDNGGMVALLGPTVSNAGSITAPSGQVILAAGNNLGLSEPVSGGVNLSVVPGLALATGFNTLEWTSANSLGSLGALTTNTAGGLLSSDRGNVTLFGDSVQQLGAIDVTTSITRTGTIDLQAVSGAVAATSPGTYLGSVVFGPSSVTAILPDENGESIPTNSISSFTAPSISILSAANVDFQSGSFVEAPGASFSISGPYAPPFSSTGGIPSGRVLLESGSTINLAGMDATVPLTDYLYTFKVTANDVADTPLAQSLIGQTVTINLLLSGTRADGETWVGSPLFASSGAGYLADVPQSINQLLSTGGSFTVAKGNGLVNFSDVIQEPGAVVNVSGGLVQFLGANIRTTRLVGADGRLYDIGSADPFIAYQGFAGQFTVDHAHWGVSETWLDPLLSGGYYQKTYTDGVSAGSVNITAVNPILEGTIVGDVLTSERQRALARAGTGGAQTTPDQLPLGAALTINLTTGNVYGDEVVLANTAPELLPAGFNFLNSPFLNATGAQNLALAGTLPVDAYGVPVITYSTSVLSAEGFESISIKGASLLSMSPGSNLSVLPGGSVSLTGVTTIDGTITAHGGKITLAGFTPTVTIGNGAAPVTYQNLVLGSDATLDVSGLWVNDAGAYTSAFLGKAYTNGGSISLTTYEQSQVNGTTELFNNGTDTGNFQVNTTDRTASLVLDAGSIIDVSSGGYVGMNGQLALGSNGLPVGTGGSLALLTYVFNPALGANWSAPVIADVNSSGYDASNNSYAPLSPNAATVVMNGTIYAGGLSNGGSFSLRAPSIAIDGAASAVSSATSGGAAGTVTLPTSFFQSGFSSYNLTSTYGSVTVTPGTTVVLKQQNYQFSPSGAFPATGTALRSFATLGFAPDGLRQAASLSLTEIPFTYGPAYVAGFTGADVNDPSTSAGVVIGTGASVLADPQASITLIAGRSLDVLGDLTAHGGSVALAGGLDIWIGTGAVIDVSGTFVPDPLITAYQTGTELAGGSITFGFSPSQYETQPGFNGNNGAVIVQSGAFLNLAGGEATVQVPRYGLMRAPDRLQTLWSDGGMLVFNGGNVLDGGSNLFLGGTIDASGGAPSAAGGTIEVGDVGVSSQASNGYSNNLFSSIVLAQGGNPAAPFAGAAPPTTASALSALLSKAGSTNGAAYVTADTLSHSGFSTVVLDGGQISFPASVSLSGLGELDLAGAIVLPSAGGSVVNFGANYIRLIGYTPTAPTLGDGTLNLTAASQIDIEGAFSVSGAANVNLSSGGDIRLIWADGSALSVPLIGFNTLADGSTAAAPALSTTSLNVPDSLTLTAREVYVSTKTQGVLLSLGLGSQNRITIASNGATPYTPLSAGGSLLVDAPTIVQDGVLYAPLGQIQLGVSTSEPVPAGLSLVGAAPLASSVILGTGSLTSVSIAGLDVPYSYTINGDWQISTLPAKQVILAGANVTTQTGAVLDLSGGGDVYATEFVAGTGGGRNVLTTTSQTVYALVPGYESDVSAPFPTDGYNLTSWSNGGTDAASAFSLQAGQTVTLPGGNGVPAGTYVLMPAMYATMPGAYRVVVASTNFNPGTSVSSVAPDGTIYTTGVFGNAITGKTSSLTAMLEIQSKAVWSKYSEIDISSANSAFTQTAAENGVVAPRLPIDAGQLILAATSSLNLNASNKFAPGSATDSSGNILTGRGGLADITGTDLLVVASDEASIYAANPAYDGAIFLDADQLSRLGVASLLIGGVRTPTSMGVTIAPTATTLTVATDADHPLTAPDLLLVTEGSITDTTATTKVADATGAQTITVATGLSGIAAGQGITLYNPASPLNWIQGTVTSYNPTTGSLTFSGGSASGSASQISNAAVLIATPSLGSGITITNGSVVKAAGSVPAGTSQNITIGADPVATGINSTTGAVVDYTPGVSGDGSLVRVSSGDDITVTRAFVPGIYSSSNLSVAFGPVSAIPEGQLAVGAATLEGNSITLDSSGTNVLAVDANLSAAHYTLAGNLINLGGTNPDGLTLSPAALAAFAGAQSVTLHSYSVFDLYGDETFGAQGAPIGTLIFDGSGLYSDGGSISIAAGNVTFQDTQPSPSATGANTGASGGTLNVSTSGAVTFGEGAQTWSGLSQVTLTTGSEVLFSGSGSVATGSANVTFATPAVVANTGASQSFTTTGSIVLAPTGGALPTLASTAVGGSLTLTGGAIIVSNSVLAPGGAITLEATSGNLTLASGAEVAAQGSRANLFGLLNEDIAAGTVKLISDKGNVVIASGASVDVSAAGLGYAGTVSISATSGAAILEGTILGSAAYKDLGGTFILNANQLSGALPMGASFSGAYSVTLGQGDILIDAGQTISSGTILLVANDGSVTINGILDASGPSGGTIALYGAGTTNGSGASATVSGGVNIGSTAQLIARYAADDPNDPANGNGEGALVQNGGTITLGTSGIGSTTNLDPAQGYEIVAPSQSGWINVASGARFDVSGGPGGANVSNTGGTVYIRAPIVENADGSHRSVNVDFSGTLITNAAPGGGPSGQGLVLEPYAVWSTTDQQTNLTKYFDGVIDPAGWYSSSGTLVAGTFKDVNGNTVATWSGSSAPSVSSVASRSVNSGNGTQVLTVQPGLNLNPGDPVELSGISGSNNLTLAGTVVSYDRVTGALVVSVTGTSNNNDPISNFRVLYGFNGSYTTSSSDAPIYTGLENIDGNGNVYFRSHIGGPAGGGYVGESLTLTLSTNTGQILTYTGVVKYYPTNQDLEFYSPSLLNDMAAGKYNFNSYTSAPRFVSIEYGATAPISVASTQPLTIGTGTKVLTIPAALSYVAGENITLTDRNTPGNSMTGTIVSYSTTTGALVLDVTSDTGTGDVPSGNWTFGVTLPQSVLNSFLANDYFTPTSLNTAHETFYGFVNGNATTAQPGTLMRFIQNPFAGNDTQALSGLAGGTIQIGQSGAPVSLNAASALHVSPEVDLINPSTTANNGDILIATDWNLGAGTVGSGGNPGSLYYRYNGWAPTLTLRAVNDVNIDASITDGFFQKVPTVGGVAPPTGTGYNAVNGNVNTSNTYLFINAHFPPSGEDLGNLTADFAPTSLQHPNGLVMAAPAVFSGETGTTPDQYYASYKSYINEWQSFFFNALDAETGSYATVATGGTALPTATANLLTTAQSMYSSTNPAAYAAYLSAYDRYLTSYEGYIGAVSEAATLPVAPLPPPAISMPVPPTIAPLVNNGPAPVRTVTDQSPIAGMDLVAEASSSSYRFVAGALFGAFVNPNAVVPAGSSAASDNGNVTLSGHLSYSNTGFSAIDSLGGANMTYNPRVDVPTIIRTGTGTIDLVAAGDIEWLDALSPAAVYTAGTVAPNASGFTVPTLPASYTSGATTNGLLNAPTWATGGGALMLSAGRDIIGIETPVDNELLATVSGTADAQTLGDNSPSMAQFWSAWYIPLSQTTGQAATPFATAAGGVQNSAYINYATFFQGVGALGGGNVTVTSGRNTYDLSVSLPETIQVSGGRFAGDSAPTVHDFGGGDLSVTVGGDLYSSAFYVGRGAGTVRVTGSALIDPANPITGRATGVYASYFSGISHGGFVNTVPIASSLSSQYTALPLLFAEQDSYITVETGGSLALGGVFQPTRLPAANYPYYPSSYLPAGFGGGFDSFGADSGVTLVAAGGNVSLADAYPPTLVKLSTSQLDSRAPDNLLPPFVEAVSVAGDLMIGNAANTGNPYFLYPSANGNLVLAAGQTLSAANALDATGQTLALNPIQMADATTFGGVNLYSELGTPTPTTLPSPLHAGDPSLALILAGQDIIGDFTLIKPARVEAGRDILNTAFVGQNNSAGDVTSIIAGRDIRSTNVIDGVTYFQIDSPVASPGSANVTEGASIFELYGPGQFEVAAGRNLGPFLVNSYSDVGGGIFALGNGSNVGVQPSIGFNVQTAVIPYLPTAGANITTLFGVGNGVNYGAAIAAYVDPAGSGPAQGISYLSEIAGYLGVPTDRAWAAFQALSRQKQDLLVDRAFLDFLTQVAADYRNPSSPYYNQYARAYDTVATLFPASYGYTDNNTGGSNGASVTVHTGDLRMARSRIETQTGGDINILGPGGGITVGTNRTDNIAPNLEGMLTLQGGSIRTYTDGSVELFQSRIFTEQGGDVDMFSANGDLNAGKGPKSSAAYPPLQLICDVDGYCSVSPAGLVTGAGIGALLTLPGQDPSLSNSLLTAPHGTVDAGAAGIRVAGNLGILALQVLNAFNIQAGGTVAGLPTVQGPPVANLTTANNVAGSAAKVDAPPQGKASEQPSIIIVEVLGYGGEGDVPNQGEEERRRKSEGERSEATPLSGSRYDTGSAVQVLGSGKLTGEENQYLTTEEQRALAKR